MMSKNPNSKVAIVLREELAADEKTFASLTEHDAGELFHGLHSAFKLTERKCSNAILMAILSDDTYLLPLSARL